jgi:hypothetical protein
VSTGLLQKCGKVWKSSKESVKQIMDNRRKQKGPRVMRKIRLAHAIVVVAAISISMLGACATKGQTGALAGGGIGALAGQVIGGNTEATLIGAAVGAGVGYIIGNEKDKKHAQEMSQATRSSNYDHSEVSGLANTRWKVVSISPPGSPIPPFASKIIEFGPSGHVRTTTTYTDGTTEVREESYRVSGDTLIVNRPGYMINATYRIYGTHKSRTMDIDAKEFHAALVQIP